MHMHISSKHAADTEETLIPWGSMRHALDAPNEKLPWTLADGGKYFLAGI